KWKVPIPGAGSATPAVWGDRVFILTAIPTGKPEVKDTTATAPAAGTNAIPHQKGRMPDKPTEFYQFVVLCLDRKTGKTLWQQVAREEVPHEGHQQENTFASASPITDGKLVFAYFGSRGLYCYDLEGKLKWSRQFGQMQTRSGFGEGASPSLYGDTLVV